ncbi:MAG: Chromosomal replication initiator protein DnaA [Candidatus Collierbacteria bacterium GW2011_GWB2_42_12]|nr:MAG: Chromosomal replication initiator protein DnaA [Candidatus Collierbacteria bacterium GW2011_GWB2_42_12]
MEIDASHLWQAVCGELVVSMSQAGFNGFVKPCYIKTITPIDNERIIVELAAPTAYHVRTIDEKYFSTIKQAMEKISHKRCDVALIVVEAQKKEKETKTSSRNEKEEPNMNLFVSNEPDKQVGNNLNPRYQFENYVMGSSNRLAFAAGKAVVDFPGTRHNPLFIYGGVGVGKTHLMHAVGHELVKKGIGKVVYVTSEQFTNDLVNSLRSKMTEVEERTQHKRSFSILLMN